MRSSPLTSTALTFSAFSLAVFLSGCGPSVDTQPMQRQADQLYEYIAQGNNDEMLDLYSEEFYEFVDRDEWQAALDDIYDALGDYRSHELVDSIITASVRLGSTVTLYYEVDYAGHRIVEQLTFRDGEIPQLIRHQFNTDADLPARHAKTEASDAES